MIAKSATTSLTRVWTDNKQEAAKLCGSFHCFLWLGIIFFFFFFLRLFPLQAGLPFVVMCFHLKWSTAFSALNCFSSRSSLTQSIHCVQGQTCFLLPSTFTLVALLTMWSLSLCRMCSYHLSLSLGSFYAFQ